MRQQQFHFQKTNSRSNWARPCMKLGQTWALISPASCCTLRTVTSSLHVSFKLDFLFPPPPSLSSLWNNYTTLKLLLIWIKSSETSLLFRFISNSNKTLKPMQDFNGWNVEEMKYSHRWEEEGEVNKMERRWDLEITLVRPITGHTHL